MAWHLSRGRRPVRTAMVAIIILLPGLWGLLALWYQLPSPLRWPLLALWLTLVGGALIAPWLPRWNRYARPLFALALGLLLAWWFALQPSHQRDWADDVARLLQSDIDGSTVTLHNVRNFDWRSEHDYGVRWETRSYDLDQLATADLVLSYWMGPHIAHTLVSFGFDDGRQLVFSLEIRKERHETFSALGGFFRQFETVLIAADEHDIVRTRTNARGEDVYLYRLDIGREALRELFLGYLQEGESIRRAPRFYNTLTSNCTTIVYDIARGVAPALPLDYRLLLSGHFAAYVAEQGGLLSGYAYPELRQLGRISPRALAFDGPADEFPRAIRDGMPTAAKAPTR